jgi:hypothetical protein
MRSSEVACGKTTNIQLNGPRSEAALTVSCTKMGNHTPRLHEAKAEFPRLANAKAMDSRVGVATVLVRWEDER